MHNITKDKVRYLINKHNTRDPFEIADGENILITFESLGSINGYYNKYTRQKFIHINRDIDSKAQLFTCAHELGHAILHPNSSTPFLRSNTFQSISKLERQANMFAAELAIADEIFDDCIGRTLKEIAYAECLPFELLELKFYNLKSNELLEQSKKELQIIRDKGDSHGILFSKKC